MGSEEALEQATERLRDALQGMVDGLCEQSYSILKTGIEDTYDRLLKDSKTKPRTGRWIRHGCFFCSECGLPSMHSWPYCANCGAKMEVEEI